MAVSDQAVEAVDSGAQSVSDATTAAADQISSSVDATSAAETVVSIVPPSAEEVAASLANALPQGPPKIGDFSTMDGIDSVWSVWGLAERYLEMIHVTTGMPWWATIVAGTILFRVVTGYVLLPGVQRNQANLQNKAPIMRPLAERMAIAKKANNKEELAAVQMEMAEKYKGSNPLAMIGGVVAQAPLFLGMFVGIRTMAAVPVPGFTTEGLWWFMDLSVADPTLMLPLLATATFAVINEVRFDLLDVI
jgi:YidC/Oxa1 family membrane protein insertase